GFTLIELMVAILVSGIVMMGVFAFATIQKDTANLQQRQIQLQQALEGSMHSIGTDLRMAGLGFGRTCSEVRVWSQAEGKLINPGAMRGDELGSVYLDQITGEPYWVLRDGVQAHWRSGPDVGANTMAGLAATSASPSSAADSFDVFRGELNMVSGSGVFRIQSMPSSSSGNAVIEFESSGLLDNGNNLQLQAVRQMFAPGSFVLVVPVTAKLSYVTEDQSQCALVQVTGEVQGAGGSTGWSLPVADTSQFNANLGALLNASGNLPIPDDANLGAVTGKNGSRFGADWDPETTPRFELIPLGRARWSRYEIDYTEPTRPTLVRADIIGWRAGDPVANISNNYPGCTGGVCRMPTLYLPSNQAHPPRVAIGPMIEDMQVAVGCDGWGPNSQPVLDNLVPVPDLGFEEKGPASGPFANTPNRKVDERDGQDDDRSNDEWVGNADEIWAPDCVTWGTGERNAIEWATSGPASEARPAPGFRLSPQVVRVTLLAKPDTVAAGSGSLTDPFYNQLVAIEDRPSMPSVVGNREYRTLTERFSVRNAHWRDPALR
ncbi:MAG: prepilin-type N-terminal cleavage/methylation domain-containing protein, partial [Enhygromyxa sp.]